LISEPTVAVRVTDSLAAVMLPVRIAADGANWR
jgi:hypothetical protein